LAQYLDHIRRTMTDCSEDPLHLVVRDALNERLKELEENIAIAHPQLVTMAISSEKLKINFCCGGAAMCL
jgi:hypothetical protein